VAVALLVWFGVVAPFIEDDAPEPVDDSGIEFDCEDFRAAATASTSSPPSDDSLTFSAVACD
jgi:hypothetical protein